jgi:hypothetical protein
MNMSKQDIQAVLGQNTIEAEINTAADASQDRSADIENHLSTESTVADT